MTPSEMMPTARLINVRLNGNLRGLACLPLSLCSRFILPFHVIDVPST